MTILMKTACGMHALLHQDNILALEISNTSGILLSSRHNLPSSAPWRLLDRGVLALLVGPGDLVI
jgi:hypothetical protein